MTDKIEPLDPKALEPIKEAPVMPAHGLAAVALNMAMKYHDINTVQDGALYQQYKLEGKNLPGLNLDMVFETAIAIERHLVGASKRINDHVVDVIVDRMGHEIADELLADMNPDGNPKNP